MDETPRSALELQIFQEEKELASVPKVPIQQFVGTVTRCHICGQLAEAESLKPFDTHVPSRFTRMACEDCHPHRGING